MYHPSRQPLRRVPSRAPVADSTTRRLTSTVTSNSSATASTSNTSSSAVLPTSMTGLIGNCSPTWRRDNTSLTAILNRAFSGSISASSEDGDRGPPLMQDDDRCRVMDLQGDAIPQSLPSRPSFTGTTVTKSPEASSMDKDESTSSGGRKNASSSFVTPSNGTKQLPPLPLWSNQVSKNVEEPSDNGNTIPTPDFDNHSAAAPPQSPPPPKANHHRHHRRTVALAGLGTVLLLTIIGVCLGLALPSGSGGLRPSSEAQNEDALASQDDNAPPSSSLGKTCPLSAILKGRQSKLLDDLTVYGNNTRASKDAESVTTMAHDWILDLATLLTPYFADADPCFPVSDAHIETLFWMMELMITNQDHSNAASQFDTEAWLQAFVVSLLARTWGVAGDPAAFANNRTQGDGQGTTDHGSSTYTNANPSVFVGYDDSLLNSFIAASPLHLCSWKGLGCSGDGRLMSLQWNDPSLDLKGTIPSELTLLSQLRLLDLSYSPNLVGFLPRPLSPYLQALYLEHTGVAGRLPSDMVSLALTDLRIKFTPRMQQNGLPSFLHQLTQLEWFEWSQEIPASNKKSMANGTIPTELGLLSLLRGLSLDGNGFSGTVPTEIGLLTMLETLDLSRNNLSSGSMPTEVGQLTRLQWLSLEESGLRGPLPMELATLQELAWLEVGGSNNDFDRETMARIFDMSPLQCSCGTWFQNKDLVDIDSFLATHQDDELSVIPNDCGCSVRGRDGD